MSTLRNKQSSSLLIYNLTWGHKRPLKMRNIGECVTFMKNDLLDSSSRREVKANHRWYYRNKDIRYTGNHN